MVTERVKRENMWEVSSGVGHIKDKVQISAHTLETLTNKQMHTWKIASESVFHLCMSPACHLV
jgi:peptidyl-tRNA hydrolase